MQVEEVPSYHDPLRLLLHFAGNVDCEVHDFRWEDSRDLSWFCELPINLVRRLHLGGRTSHGFIARGCFTGIGVGGALGNINLAGISISKVRGGKVTEDFT